MHELSKSSGAIRGNETTERRFETNVQGSDTKESGFESNVLGSAMICVELRIENLGLRNDCLARPRWPETGHGETTGLPRGSRAAGRPAETPSGQGRKVPINDLDWPVSGFNLKVFETTYRHVVSTGKQVESMGKQIESMGR